MNKNQVNFYLLFTDISWFLTSLGHLANKYVKEEKKSSCIFLGLSVNILCPF